MENTTNVVPDKTTLTCTGVIREAFLNDKEHRFDSLRTYFRTLMIICSRSHTAIKICLILLQTQTQKEKEKQKTEKKTENGTQQDSV